MEGSRQGNMGERQEPLSKDNVLCDKRNKIQVWGSRDIVGGGESIGT